MQLTQMALPATVPYSMSAKQHISLRAQRPRQSRNTITKHDDLISLANLCFAADNNDGGMIGFSKSGSSAATSTYPTRGRAVSSRRNDDDRTSRASLILKLPRASLKFKTTGRSQNSSPSRIHSEDDSLNLQEQQQQPLPVKHNEVLSLPSRQANTKQVDEQHGDPMLVQGSAVSNPPLAIVFKNSHDSVTNDDSVNNLGQTTHTNDLSQRNLSYRQCFLPVGTIFSFDARNSSLQLQKVSVGNATFIHANKDLRTLDPSLVAQHQHASGNPNLNSVESTPPVDFCQSLPHIAPVFQLVVNGSVDSKTGTPNMASHNSFPLYIPLSRMPDTALLCAQDASLNIVAWQSPFFYTQS